MLYHGSVPRFACKIINRLLGDVYQTSGLHVALPFRVGERELHDRGQRYRWPVCKSQDHRPVHSATATTVQEQCPVQLTTAAGACSNSRQLTTICRPEFPIGERRGDEQVRSPTKEQPSRLIRPFFENEPPQSQSFQGLVTAPHHLSFTLLHRVFNRRFECQVTMATQWIHNGIKALSSNLALLLSFQLCISIRREGSLVGGGIVVGSDGTECLGQSLPSMDSVRSFVARSRSWAMCSVIITVIS